MSIIDVPSPSISDPYFGLLTDPPGRWGLIAYGNDKALILQGIDLFLTKAINFLSSFAGGKIDGQASRSSEITISARWEGDRVSSIMIPISERRLKIGLSLWFYTQLWSRRAPTNRHLFDEDGDYAGVRELTSRQEGEIKKEAEALASSFYAQIEHDSLGCGFGKVYSPPTVEHGMGIVDQATGTDD